MTIKYCCPAGHRLVAPDDQAGKEICCPVCRQQAIVPTQTTANGSGPAPPPLPESLPVGESREVRQRPWTGWFHPQLQAVPPDAYEADEGKVQTVKWLALILGSVVVFSVVPAVAYLNLQTAPGWARTVLLLAALQAVYILWMTVTPDWSSVWVVMLAFAFVAALYGTATAIAIATPLDEPMPLGMGEVRASAPRWCGCVLLMNALATYLCGRTSTRWRRSFELETAAKKR